MITEDEAKRKIADPSWRINHLYKIKTKDRRLITFKQNKAQRTYWSKKTLRDIILKARQLGFTTEKLIELLDFAISNENANCAIIAHQRDKVSILFEIVRLAYSYLPEPLKPVAGFDNRNELYFPDINSKIFVSLDTRGETIHNLHVSELAFVENAEEKMLGILESVPKDAPISFESTANGMSGYFHETYQDRTNEFAKHFYNWTLDDGYVDPTMKSIEELYEDYEPLAIRYGLIKDIADRFSLSKEQFQWYINKVIRHRSNVVQEYPTTDLEAFIASGRNVFSIVDLQKHKVKNPISRKWQDLLIWEEPMQGFRYVIGCDPSEGTGNDSSIIEVLNAYTGEQVAEFASNRIQPDILAGYLIEIGKWYNNALIVPEMNGNAGGTLLNCLRGKYLNIYRRESFDKHTKQYSESLGWKTSGTTKPILVQELEQRIREESILVNSEDAIKEMRTFVQTDEVNKQGFGAEGSNHDDRVIALGLAVQGLKSIPKQAKPKTIAQQKLEDYIRKHNIVPEIFDDRAVINHHNRPNSGIKRRG